MKILNGDNRKKKNMKARSSLTVVFLDALPWTSFNDDIFERSYLPPELGEEEWII
jgi:hypothetical protein